MKKIFYGTVFLFFISFSLAAQQSDAAKVKYYEQVIGQLGEQIKNIQDENARLAAQLKTLERKLADAEEETKTVKNDFAALKKAVVADSEARDKQLKQLYAQLEKIVNNVQTNNNSSNSNSGNSRPSDDSSSTGSFAEYTVQKGATLSAIAKAYDVSVQDIKKANNMKNDFLREGQKLRIPVK